MCVTSPGSPPQFGQGGSSIRNREQVPLMGGCGILARRRGHHDISSMRLSSLIITWKLVWALVLASAASAQVIPPGGSQFNPPIPAPPPPPKIEVPVVPKMDAPPT